MAYVRNDVHCVSEYNIETGDAIVIRDGREARTGKSLTSLNVVADFDADSNPTDTPWGKTTSREGE